MQPRPRPRIISDNVSNGGRGTKKPPRRLSDETRQKLSENAVERHKKGGFAPIPGRPKRKPSRARIAELVALEATEKKTARAIIDVFKDGISSNQPMHIRLRTVEAWLRIDTEQAKIELHDAHHEEDRMEREEALKFLADRLSQGASASLLRKQLDKPNLDGNGNLVLEGEVVDDEDAA